MVGRDVEGGQVMEQTDYDLISKMADAAHDKAARAKANAEKYKVLAGDAARMRREDKAHTYRKLAAGYLNDYFYWIGHYTAYRGIAAGLALREVVEQEIDETPSCP